ncbi:MAG: HAD family hydrolase [Muribaculaceae bacterium]
MKQNSVIIFDLDDTLYKEIDFVDSAFKHIDKFLANEYKVYNTYEVMIHAQHKGKNPFDAILCDKFTIDELLKLYRFHMPNIRLSDVTIDVLSRLHSEGYTLGLITDGRSISQRNKIEALHLSKYFDNENIIISEVFGSEKTDIRNYQYFTTKFPRAKHFYYIGDNPTKDFINANLLGWTTICLRDNGTNIHRQDIEIDDKYKPKIIINDLTDLYNIIFKS